MIFAQYGTGTRYPYHNFILIEIFCSLSLISLYMYDYYGGVLEETTAEKLEMLIERIDQN